MKKTLYLDVETTGFDPKNNDIIQIAGIIEINNEIMDTFCFCCQPRNYHNISQKALDINGMTLEQIRAFENPQKTYSRIIDVMGKHVNPYDKTDKFTLAGQNVPFDSSFLKEFFIKSGDFYYGSWITHRYVDLLSLVRILNYAGSIQTDNDKLSTIAEKFNIDFVAHDALSDITVTRILLKLLVDKYIIREAVVDD